MDDGKKDGIPLSGVAADIGAVAENEPEGIGCLVPGATSLSNIWFFCICQFAQTRMFEWIRKIRCSEAVTEQFCKSPATRPSPR